jgi:hypothetical protein
VSILTSTPVQLNPTEPYICDVAASEKYACRELGFTSDFSPIGLAMAREGITIRVSIDSRPRILAEIPLTGKDSFTAPDINVIEALLRRRLQDESSYRRDRYPRLHQVGHVLHDKLASYIHDMRHTTPRLRDIPYDDGSGRTVRRAGLGQPVKWVSLKTEQIGQKSVSEDMDEVEALCKNLDTRPMQTKKKMLKLVEKMVRVYKERGWTRRKLLKLRTTQASLLGLFTIMGAMAVLWVEAHEGEIPLFQWCYDHRDIGYTTDSGIANCDILLAKMNPFSSKSM